MSNLISKNEAIIIIWLLENEEGSVRELIRETELSQFAIYNNCNRLIRKKLIIEAVGANRKVIFTLSEFGTTVAKDYQELDDKYSFSEIEE